MAVLVLPVTVDLGETVHELEEDEFLEDFVVLVKAAVQGTFDSGVGEHDAMPQLAHPERVQEVPEVGEHLVLGVVLGSYKRQLRAEVPVDLGDQGGITETELEAHGLALRQGVVADYDVAVLVEAADAQVVGLLTHQERVVEGRLRTHESFEHVAEAFRRQRGLTLADFQLARRPGLFLLCHGSGREGDFFRPADDEFFGMGVLGEVQAENRFVITVFDVATVDQLDVLTLVGCGAGVRVDFEGAVSADFAQEHAQSGQALRGLDVHEQAELVHQRLVAGPIAAGHAAFDGRRGDLDEIDERFFAQLMHEEVSDGVGVLVWQAIGAAHPLLRFLCQGVTQSLGDGFHGGLIRVVMFEGHLAQFLAGTELDGDLGVQAEVADDAQLVGLRLGDIGVGEVGLGGEGFGHAGAQLQHGEHGGVFAAATSRDAGGGVFDVVHKGGGLGLDRVEGWYF